jgi:hypothetical protein
VETKSRIVTAAFRSALLLVGLLARAGCHAENSSGEANGNEEEHTGHVIPAHKPKTFPDAVRRLRELNE